MSANPGPLDDGSGNWTAVPPQSFVTVSDGTIDVRAFARELVDA